MFIYKEVAVSTTTEFQTKFVEVKQECFVKANALASLVLDAINETDDIEEKRSLEQLFHTIRNDCAQTIALQQKVLAQMTKLRLVSAQP